MNEGNSSPALRAYWHPVARCADLNDKPLAVLLLNERLALFRMPQGVVCMQDLCIHRGTPLSLGWIDGDHVVCAYHGWNYNGSGVCTRIPALSPDRPIPEKARVPAYRCAERYGLVWVCMGHPRAPIPECPEYNDCEYTSYLVGPFTWECGAARSIENFVDQAHFPWVHEGILGDRSCPETFPVHVQRCAEELQYSFVDRPNPMHPIAHRRVYRIYRPFAIHQRKERENGQVETSFFVVTPHSSKRSTNYLYVLRNFRLSDDELRKRYELDVKIMLQDKVILENQRPEELPLDLSEELHIKGPDAVAIEYRRMLGELGVK
ncbi:MAG: aromatic ring-hydroxylating dioxygenase subunit alpha [Bryobacteraceae bacterium]